MDNANKIAETCKKAKAASYRVAVLPAETKNAALIAMADAIQNRAAAILRANAADVADALKAKLAPPLIDRLRLTEKKLAQTVQGVRDVAALPDPVGETIEETTRPNGLVGLYCLMPAIPEFLLVTENSLRPRPRP